MIPNALQSALPETLAAWDALTALAAAQGITFALNDFGGVRTQADTTLIEQYRQTDFNAAVSSGQIPADTTLQQFRPIAPYGKSYHDYGAAFDIAPVAYPASLGYDGAVNALGALAPQAGLRWGGHFTNADPAHFELAITLAAASAKWSNWVASGEQSDALTTTQELQVAAQDPMMWGLVAAITYTAFVVWRALRPRLVRYAEG